MYKFIFYLVDINDNVLFSTNSLQDIADLFEDSNIANCKNEVELVMYLMDHYFHHIIKDVKYYFAQQNINNISMTFTITYKQL